MGSCDRIPPGRHPFAPRSRPSVAPLSDHAPLVLRPESWWPWCDGVLLAEAYTISTNAAGVPRRCRVRVGPSLNRLRFPLEKLLLMVVALKANRSFAGVPHDPSCYISDLMFGYSWLCQRRQPHRTSGELGE